MSYTTPASSVAGTALTAAFLNTYLRDDVAWLATDAPCCRVSHSTTQSIANVTNKSLVFDADRFDNASMHDTGSNTARITVPSGGGGKYLFGVNIAWASSIQHDIWFELNGTDASSTNLHRVTWPATTKSFLDGFYSLAAADFITATVLQASGAAVNIAKSASYSPEFWAVWQRT